MLGEYDGSGAAMQELVWLGDTPVAMMGTMPCLTGGSCTESGVAYVWADHLNTPRELTRVNASNQHVSIWKWDSLPFGETTPNANPSNLGVMTFNHRFPGQYKDSETGLHQNWNRDYDPRLGRYVQSDSIGLLGGLNTYAYGASNPISHSDSRGTVYCSYSVSSGGMICYTNDFTRQWTGTFTSGNNNSPGCQDNPLCEAIKNIGPAPRTCYTIGALGFSTRSGGRVLTPIDPNSAQGRTDLQTHACKNPWGPTATTGSRVCSAGCVVSNQQTIAAFNNFLSSDTQSNGQEGGHVLCVGN